MKSILLALGVLMSVPALAGNEGGHGGDPYALEFKTIARELAADLTRADAKLFTKWNFSADAFSKQAKTVRVVSAEGEEMALEGFEVDAINFPAQNLIKVNRTRWRESDIKARTRLVLHEVFGLIGVERDKYDASLDFADVSLGAAKRLGAGGSLMVNLFYGRCLSFPAFSEPDTCDEASPKFARAEACARTQAEGKCRIAGRQSCQVISVTAEARMSSTTVGLRFCEHSVVLK